MKINLTECNGMSGAGGLFTDLNNYNAIDEWIEDMLKGKADTHPAFLMVCVNKTNYVLINGCSSDRNAGKMLLEIKKSTPRDLRIIPNDTAEINYDVFEHEMVITL